MQSAAGDSWTQFEFASAIITVFVIPFSTSQHLHSVLLQHSQLARGQA